MRIECSKCKKLIPEREVARFQLILQEYGQEDEGGLCLNCQNKFRNWLKKGLE